MIDPIPTAAAVPYLKAEEPSNTPDAYVPNRCDRRRAAAGRRKEIRGRVVKSRVVRA